MLYLNNLLQIEDGRMFDDEDEELVTFRWDVRHIKNHLDVSKSFLVYDPNAAIFRVTDEAGARARLKVAA